jgi:hypothetical protein
MTLVPFTAPRDSRFGPLLPASTLFGFVVAIAAAVVAALFSYASLQASGVSC